MDRTGVRIAALTTLVAGALGFVVAADLWLAQPLMGPVFDAGWRSLPAGIALFVISPLLIPCSVAMDSPSGVLHLSATLQMGAFVATVNAVYYAVAGVLLHFVLARLRARREARPGLRHPPGA